MPRVLEHTHFYWLTVALVGMLVAGALSREAPDSLTLTLIEYSSVFMLLLSLLSLTAERKWARWFFLVVGSMLAAVLGRGLTKYGVFEYVFLVLLLLFFLMAAWLVASRVLLTGRVDTNKIVGSIALYLLIGLIFSILYTMLLEVSPGAIRGIPEVPWFDAMPLATYFSFVTLTTLGYGDMTPVTPTAQMVVVIEAVTGMFYLAIIVATLIGARREDHSGPS